MPTYLLTHHFPNNYKGSPEAAAAATAWFKHLGAHHMGGGNPAVATRTLGNCETDAGAFAYTLVAADNLDAAVALAEVWPLLARGGGVEVRELTLLHAVAETHAGHDPAPPAP